ncbi:very-long-chain (3R)-3-hydroxyacyl-CoA dehydratase isoform X5 [Antennarius striatus]|uniref:very-long-chain (3R)-3-hydroxyacyl-CoA dehydratase isoform X5 n=1 Tax=Antennarius striatus TaxID=241820 RepID=UPI0035B421FF
MTLTPLVYWAQRHEEIYLRVELTDAQNINVHVHGKVLHFRAQGHGAKGQNEYEFNLEFLLPVKPEVTFRSTQRQVNITVWKEERGWWERPSAHERKPVYLAPDFDRWLDESDAEKEIQENEIKRNKLRASRHKEDSLYNTFHTISDVMFFCQILAAVEVLNAAFGVVRTAVIPTLIQVVGRNFILFIIFGSLEEIHNQPVVFFVFYLWSAIEIFRYPFYMLGCFNTEWKILTWLRYTVWIPLYPLGVIAEAVAVIQSISIFDKTKLFSIPLPKAFGPAVSFSYFLYVYLILMCLGLFFNLNHLYMQRKRRFGTKKRKAN